MSEFHMVSPAGKSRAGRLGRGIGLSLLLLCLASMDLGADPVQPNVPGPVQRTAQQDHQRMLSLPNIKHLRPGANGRNRNAPNTANYDEAKANPHPAFPDPPLLNHVSRVTTAQQWRVKRRSELLELISRKVYGRVPEKTPAVQWEVKTTEQHTVGDIPAVTKRLVGHVDNTAYPEVAVDIQLILTTPAAAKGRVPVIMEFGFGGSGRFTRPAGFGGGMGPTWQQQLLAKGWGCAVIVPNSIQSDNGAGLTRGIIGLCNRGQLRKPEDWGALRAWAWGASRALDYFETDPAVDAKRGTTEYPPQEKELVEGEIAFREHRQGHAVGPNWPVFLQYEERYLKSAGE